MALAELSKIVDPTYRAQKTWEFIQEIHPQGYSPQIISDLCEAIDDKSPFFTEAKILQAEAKISQAESIFTDDSRKIEDRYLSAINILFSLNDSTAKRMRTTFANAFLENGVPGGNALKNLDVSSESIIDLLKVGQKRGIRINKLKAESAAKDLRIKELEAKLAKALNGQK